MYSEVIATLPLAWRNHGYEQGLLEVFGGGFAHCDEAEMYEFACVDKAWALMVGSQFCL